MSIYKVLPVITFLLSLKASGQDAGDLKYYQTNYPSENVVCTKKETVIRFKVINDTLDVINTTEKNNLVLNEKGTSDNMDYIYQTYFIDANFNEAITYLHEGKKTKKIPVTDYRSNTSVSEGIFFDDVTVKSVFFPGLTTGAETHVKYTEVYKEPRLFGMFYFGAGVFVDNAAVTLEIPKGVEVTYTLKNADTSFIHITTTRTDKVTKISFSAHHVPKFASEEDAPSWRYFEPHILFRVKSYTKKSGEIVNVINANADLYKWCSGFIKNLDKEVYNVLKSTVDSITTGTTNETENVKRIFYFVQSNIKYLAIEDKLGGYVPRQAVDILKHKYGDCKDIANLLHTLLSVKGIRSYLTWIGSRDIPYSCSQFPTPMCFNHMIVTYISPDNDTLFLDATGKYQAYNIPTSMIQGQECLISVDTNKYIFKHVPLVVKDVNVLVDTVRITIDKNIIKGNSTNRYTGYWKEHNDRIWSNSKEQLDDFVRGYADVGNNKLSISNAHIMNTDDRNVPSILKFDFTLPDYCQRINNELYLNMNISKPLISAYDIKPDRKIPVDIAFRYVQKYTVILSVQDGGEVQYIPKDVNYNNDKFGYTISYSKTKSAIIMSRQIYINDIDLTGAEIDAFSNMLTQLKKNFSESISIKF